MADLTNSTMATKSLACRQCERRFTRPENLARHMKTHEVLQKHCCQTCGRQFTRSDLRRKHELVHSRRASTRAKAKAMSRSAMAEPIAGAASPSDLSMHTSVVHSVDRQDGQTVDPTYHDPPTTQSSGAASFPSMDTLPVPGELENIDVSTEMYFDYDSFARPWDYDTEHLANPSGWFSEQFFAAMRETEFAYTPSFNNWARLPLDSLQPDASMAFQDHAGLGPPQLRAHRIAHGDVTGRMSADIDLTPGTGSNSRAPSPPNERSQEDRMPFAWDPRSRPIAKAKPVMVRADDPIFHIAKREYEVSEDALARLRHFLRDRTSLSQADDAFTLPSLPLINVFVSLYFKHFSSGAHVLHSPTLDVTALPSALLAIIMVIGSTHSRLRHTRRFGIVLFDRIRRNIQYDIESENSLMRDPYHIFALSLVCFMGLWCGNKRAFELGEALQSVIVTYVRHLPSEADSGANYGPGGPLHAMRTKFSLQHQWSRWITFETTKRVKWFVYTLDAQFCSLLGLRNIMVLSEMRKWELPCDDASWAAPNARAWKNLLGSASQPSCPVFGPIAAALLAPLDASSGIVKNICLPRLNAWGASVFLSVIVSEIFHVDQRSAVSVTHYGSCHGTRTSPTQSGIKGKLHLSLQLWSEAFMETTPCKQGQTYSHRASGILFHLAYIYSRLSLVDIQDCLGKSGPGAATDAFDNIRFWAHLNPDEAYLIIQDASRCITYVLKDDTDTAPYDLIGLFLSHLAIWVIAHVANQDQKKAYITKLQKDILVAKDVAMCIEAGFTCHDAPVAQEPKLILRHAIQSLVKRGTWGASSNLALLLHLHPGVATQVWSSPSSPTIATT